MRESESDLIILIIIHESDLITQNFVEWTITEIFSMGHTFSIVHFVCLLDTDGLRESVARMTWKTAHKNDGKRGVAACRYKY